MNKEAMVYLTGRYDNGILEYAFYIDSKDEFVKIKGSVEKPENNAQISAMGALLKFIERKEYDAYINTDFRNAVDMADETASYSDEQTEKYRKLIASMRKNADIQFTYIKEIPYEIMEILFPSDKPAPEQSKEKTVHECWADKNINNNYRVIVCNPDNTILCDLNQKDFSDRGSALYFVNWYLQESRNPESIYYGCKVKHYGLVTQIKTE